MRLIGNGFRRRATEDRIVAMMATDLPTKNFLNIDFVDASFQQLAAELDRLSRSDRFCFVVTPNVDHVVLLNRIQHDDVIERFRSSYAAAAIRICDSQVLQALAWFRGVSLRVIAGSDLTEFLFEKGHFDGRKVGLIGGDDKMLAELNQRYPAIQLVQHVPPMGILDDEPAILNIEKFTKINKLDYILFAIGAPRSEIIAHRCASIDGAVGVALCIGASVEFLLGWKTRAPRWIQFVRMEWAFRLLSEPQRLWRRYLVSGPRILLIVRNWQKP